MYFNKKLALAVLEGSEEDIKNTLKEEYPDVEFYCNGLAVEWVPEGAKFRIDEYDGSESVILLDEENYYTA